MGFEGAALCLAHVLCFLPVHACVVEHLVLIIYLWQVNVDHLIDYVTSRVYHLDIWPCFTRLLVDALMPHIRVCSRTSMDISSFLAVCIKLHVREGSLSEDFRLFKVSLLSHVSRWDQWTVLHLFDVYCSMHTLRHLRL